MREEMFFYTFRGGWPMFGAGSIWEQRCSSVKRFSKILRNASGERVTYILLRTKRRV